ncbi:exodeoxyribonuclease III [Arcobacteraceae bacterium]|nr:exodeoxyribonuclease III [Arcobacteraceae bacterium]
MKTYRFISWNVNGIRAVEKKEALKWVDNEIVNILGLQEIKAEEDQIPETIFNKEYAFKHINPCSIKGRSGTALYSDIEPFFHDNTPNVDILDEGRINEAHFNFNDKKIAYFNVYFPNGQSKEERLIYKMDFYDRFLDHCENLKKDAFSIIVCGDVNTAHYPIDLARPKANEKKSGFLPMEREWMDKFIEHGYIDTLRHIKGDEEELYSWWSYRANARVNNVGWRIDYFYVSEDLKGSIKDAYILNDYMGSDHCPIVLEIEL